VLSTQTNVHITRQDLGSIHHARLASKSSKQKTKISLETDFTNFLNISKPARKKLQQDVKQYQLQWSLHSAGSELSPRGTQAQKPAVFHTQGQGHTSCTSTSQGTPLQAKAATCC
jgi:hypothetical protein